jgi:hypothetical protein
MNHSGGYWDAWRKSEGRTNAWNLSRALCGYLTDFGFPWNQANTTWQFLATIAFEKHIERIRWLSPLGITLKRSKSRRSRSPCIQCAVLPRSSQYSCRSHEAAVPDSRSFHFRASIVWEKMALLGFTTLRGSRPQRPSWLLQVRRWGVGWWEADKGPCLVKLSTVYHCHLLSPLLDVNGR